MKEIKCPCCGAPMEESYVKCLYKSIQGRKRRPTTSDEARAMVNKRWEEYRRKKAQII